MSKSWPLGTKFHKNGTFSVAKVLARPAPAFPSGPIIAADYKKDLVVCPSSMAAMKAVISLPEGAPVRIDGVVGGHNFLGLTLKPGCTIVPVK